MPGEIAFTKANATSGVAPTTTDSKKVPVNAAQGVENFMTENFMTDTLARPYWSGAAH